MAKNFDYWIVIEGLTAPGGSTGWCKDLKLPPRSIDGTHQFMEGFSKQHPHVVYYSKGTKWSSKDEMVNEAVKVVKMVTDECFLWQVDADEQWTSQDLHEAEMELKSKGEFAGAFQFNHLLPVDALGRQLVARGQWGDGFNIRLWDWKGQKFVSHEPPVMQGQKTVAQLSQVYQHHSYEFDEDIMFKGLFYGGHEYIPQGIAFLKKYKGALPLPITALFGERSKKFNPKMSFIDSLENHNKSCKKKDAVLSQSQEQ